MAVKLAIPTTPTELEECLSDPTTVAQIRAAGQWDEFTEAYVTANAKKDPGIQKQTDEQIRAVVAEILKENPDLAQRAQDVAPLTENLKRQPSNVYNPEALGSKIEGEFKDLADFLRTTWHRNQSSEAVAKKLKISNALSSSVPADGGFLIPETMRAELLRVALETAIVRPRARVVPMDSLRLPFPTLDSTSNVSSVSGGVTAYWTEEAATLTASQPAFGRIVLEAKKLTAYTEVPNELLADSAIPFASLIEQIFPEALAWFEDVAFISGTGVGEPLGVLNSGNPALLAVTKETGQAASTIVWENIVKMYARMLPSSLNRAVWLASPDTFPELATMALSVGTGGSAVWLNNGVEGPPVSILGRPVIFTEKTAALSSQGDIAFVDFAQYLIGDRQAMSSESSAHYKFANDVTAFRVIERVDGRPWMQSAITPKNNGNTLSPYVALGSR